jgi:hypothetical protein
MEPVINRKPVPLSVFKNGFFVKLQLVASPDNHFPNKKVSVVIIIAQSFDLLQTLPQNPNR